MGLAKKHRTLVTHRCDRYPDSIQLRFREKERERARRRMKEKERESCDRIQCEGRFLGDGVRHVSAKEPSDSAAKYTLVMTMSPVDSVWQAASEVTDTVVEDADDGVAPVATVVVAVVVVVVVVVDTAALDERPWPQ